MENAQYILSRKCVTKSYKKYTCIYTSNILISSRHLRVTSRNSLPQLAIKINFFPTLSITSKPSYLIHFQKRKKSLRMLIYASFLISSISISPVMVKNSTCSLFILSFRNVYFINYSMFQCDLLLFSLHLTTCSDDLSYSRRPSLRQHISFFTIPFHV